MLWSVVIVGKNQERGGARAKTLSGLEESLNVTKRVTTGSECASISCRDRVAGVSATERFDCKTQTGQSLWVLRSLWWCSAENSVTASSTVLRSFLKSPLSIMAGIIPRKRSAG